MASSSSGLIAGTPQTWQSSGGTNVITCTSLASGAARQGAKGANSLLQIPSGLTNATMPELLEIDVQLQITSAPAAGSEVQIFAGFSNSATAGTDNPGGLSGADGALGNIDQLPQLVFAGAVVLSNALGTGVQSQKLYITPGDLYMIPVVYNICGTALDATALHTVITVTPWYREQQS